MTRMPKGLPDWINDHIELYPTDPEKAHHWDASLAGGEGILPTLLLIYKKVGDSGGRLGGKVLMGWVGLLCCFVKAWMLPR